MIKKITLRLLKWIVFLLCVLLVIYFVLNFYVNKQLEKRSYRNVYSECHKVWATRGLVTDKGNYLNDRNSIASINKAFATGARGTEVDLFFDTELGEYVISHDRPYNLKDGKLLSLKSLLAQTGGKHYFWLDFKKLRHLDLHEVKKAVKRLELITTNNNLKKWIYIEGADPGNLSYFSDAGFNTLFDVHPLPESKPLTTIIANIYKMAYYFGDFTVMGMKYGDAGDPVYGKTVKKILKHIPIFIYHVPNDIELIKEVSKIPMVRVILNQEDTVNNYKIDSCSL